MKSKILFIIGFLMFSLGSYFSEKHNIIIVVATLGAIIMGCSFICELGKKIKS